jgi:hypothetical protein
MAAAPFEAEAKFKALGNPISIQTGIRMFRKDGRFLEL